MYVFGARWCGWRGVEKMKGLGLGFTNPLGIWGVLDTYLCFGCGGVGGVGGEWVGRVLWCYLCVKCESGLSVYMVGPGIWGGKVRLNLHSSL